MDTDFAAQRLIPISPVSREKGWRAQPILELGSAGIQAQVSTDPQTHGRLGLFSSTAQGVSVPARTKGVLAQEIKNARGGQYTFTIRMHGAGTSKAIFERCFGTAMECRLNLLKFVDMNKNPLQAINMGSAVFQPTFGSWDKPQEFTVSSYLASDVPGVNFSIGSGLGVSITMETATPLELLAGESAYLAIHDVRLEFTAHRRNDKVTI